MNWKLKTIKKIENSKNSLLISGLPGIGNVGKLAIDFLIDDLKAKKAYEIYSPRTHNCVFVNEENLIEMPFISIYYKNIKGKDLFLLTGDVQPLDGISCYGFCNEVLSFCKKNNCKEVITLGGVGLKEVPKNPKVYFTGNNKDILKKYNDTKKLNSLTGPIIGVSGLLVGLAADKKIPGISILAETLSQQNYIGTNGAKEILAVLDKKLDLGLNIKRMKKEMKEIEVCNESGLINEEEYDLDFLENIEKAVEAEEKVIDNKKDVNYIG